jgi:glutaredoxin 3
MPRVTIYTTLLCPFCHMTKQLLRTKGVAYDEIDVGREPQLREEMPAKAGGRHTVPQIWIGDTHVGGYDELYAFDRAGKLDQLLAA